MSKKHKAAPAPEKAQTPEPTYTPEEQVLLARLERDLKAHMEAAKPKRYAHSLSVAKTAEQLALTYGVNAFDARVAGTLHDWDKVLSREEQLAEACAMGIDLGVDLTLVAPLLHGMTAARRLAQIYPELSPEVLQAIDRHTTGAPDMTPLDMVVFVADGIEPLRPASPGIEAVRSLVGTAQLDDLYWESFAGGVEYVIRTRRYLYPGTLDIYNATALARGKQEKGTR